MAYLQVPTKLDNYIRSRKKTFLPFNEKDQDIPNAKVVLKSSNGHWWSYETWII